MFKNNYKKNIFNELNLSPLWIFRKFDNIDLIKNFNKNFFYKKNFDFKNLSKKITNCKKCNLYKTKNQSVFGHGNYNAKCMIVGEAPGRNEDFYGEPFIGKSGKLLDNILFSLSLIRYKDVYISNIIKCRPPYNRDPDKKEIENCIIYLKKEISLVNPKVIILLGKYAAQGLLNTSKSISVLRTCKHKYEGISVIVTYHPAYLLHNFNAKLDVWKDLCLVKKIINI